MTDTNPDGWPDEAHEAVEAAVALCAGCSPMMVAHNALAALAPFVAAREAAAREAGMQQAVVYLKGNAAADAWMKDIRALPIPEDKP